MSRMGWLPPVTTLQLCQQFARLAFGAPAACGGERYRFGNLRKPDILRRRRLWGERYFLPCAKDGPGRPRTAQDGPQGHYLLPARLHRKIEAFLRLGNTSPPQTFMGLSQKTDLHGVIAKTDRHGIIAKSRLSWDYQTQQPPEAVNCIRRLSLQARAFGPFHVSPFPWYAPGALVRLSVVHHHLLIGNVHLHGRPQVTQLCQEIDRPQIAPLGFTESPVPILPRFTAVCPS